MLHAQYFEPYTTLWRAYQEAPIDPETGERQYTEAQKRMMTLYLAPGATDLFTFNRIALQGGIKGRRERPDPHGVDLYADKIETAVTHCFLRT